MKIYLVNYSNRKYDELRVKQASLGASVFDGVYSFTEDLLKTYYGPFIRTHEATFKQERGAGYWLWKPFIILQTLTLITEGDVAFYMDSGDTFAANIKDFLATHFKAHDYLLTNGCFTQEDWTKGDCFHLMNCDTESYKKAKQLEAGVCGFKNTPEIRKFVSEWLAYCSQPHILTDIPNAFSTNAATFKDHRHDQSILTNLALREGMKGTDAIRPYITCNAH